MAAPCTHGMMGKPRGGGATAAGPCRDRREPGDGAMVDGRRAQVTSHQSINRTFVGDGNYRNEDDRTST